MQYRRLHCQPSNTCNTLLFQHSYCQLWIGNWKLWDENKPQHHSFQPYCFIDYLDFLIANSSYSPPGKKPFQFLQFCASLSSKALSFRCPEYSPKSQFWGLMLNAWSCVLEVVLLRIKQNGKIKKFWFLQINRQKSNR